jgi:hypothetical protein
MSRTSAWLGALICTGWLCSNASAFGLLARLRGGQGAVVSADTPAPPGTTIVNGQVTNGNGPNTNGSVNSEASANCEGGRNGIGGGYLGGLGGKLGAAKAHVNAWLLDVPQKRAPLPPPPAPAHPWVRSPRDYFMVGDP